MPILDDERREVFAQLKAQGKKNVEAFLAAGYGSDNQKANEASAARMRHEPEVEARIRELQAFAAEEVGITLVRWLKEIEQYAFSGKARPSTLKALDMIARHLGAYKDQMALTGKDGGPIQTESMTDIEAARRIAFLLAKGMNAS